MPYHKEAEKTELNLKLHNLVLLNTVFSKYNSVKDNRLFTDAYINRLNNMVHSKTVAEMSEILELRMPI